MTSLADTSGFHLVATLLFFLEVYHFVAHCCVFFRIRLLPAKDLVKVRYYFLADTATVFATNFLYTGQLRWLAAIQMVQHFFFYFTWKEHWYTKKVIAWSSLDWQFSTHRLKWTWDVALGTFFDIAVHAVNAYILSQFLTNMEILGGCSLVVLASALVLFNKKFAWSTPGSEPEWVKKRVTPVSDYYTPSS